MLTAHERSIEIEKRIFAELRQTSCSRRPHSPHQRSHRGSRSAGQLRPPGGVAELRAAAASASPVLEAVSARHPVVERLIETAGQTNFVANDLYLETGGPSLLLITGPNMGGKSTYLRQAALLVIMAQMGCFVPATRMRLGIVDRIYTRIGASDNVARGRSTFMVEMTETATILNTATYSHSSCWMRWAGERRPSMASRSPGPR